MLQQRNQLHGSLIKTADAKGKPRFIKRLKSSQKKISFVSSCSMHVFLYSAGVVIGERGCNFELEIDFDMKLELSFQRKYCHH